MEQTRVNGVGNGLSQYETPFADMPVMQEQPDSGISTETLFSQLFQSVESPFSRTYESVESGNKITAGDEEFVDFLGELNDPEFNEMIYELAGEVEESWRSKVSNEVAMGSNFIPFATQQARDYFTPMQLEAESMIDRVAQHFTTNSLADQSEGEIENFFQSLEFNHGNYTPVQEQFFGKIFDKVKSVVKKGVDLAKKGIAAVGKVLPINGALKKLKGLIKPLLDKVLKFAIGKLPKNLRPHAQSLAKKFLNLETMEVTADDNVESEASLDGIQAEIDNYIAQLVFSPNENEADNLVVNYESSFENIERVSTYETGYTTSPSIDAAREQLMNELKNLQPGESAAPAIERFLPAAILALQPVIKIAITLIGRQKVINFLADLLSKLISKYVPANVVKPLATSIIDVGMSAIGFEVHETGKADLGYEAIVNTIQETVQNMKNLDESTLNDTEELTMNLLEAFEQAAANNFPPQYIREELRPTKQKATWVAMPRNLPVKMYKKFTHVYDVTIEPQTASAITTFRNLPLANFLRDKYGLDASKPIRARVHLYETNHGGRLNLISKFENLPGLNARQPKAWVQLLPLTKQAASLLLKEPALGKDVEMKKIATRFQSATGQRYYYLEINGARLRIPPVNRSGHKHSSGNHPAPATESRSADIQAIINFVKSEIKLNYYFSEEDAKAVVEKLNSNDFLGAAINIRQSVKTVLNNMLLKNIPGKVKIIHEAIPELYLENINEQQQQFTGTDLLGKTAGKEIISRLIGQLTEAIAGKSYDAVAAFFKARAAEFKQAQAAPQDGVTIKLTWSKVAGMSAIRTMINAIRGKLSIGNLSDLAVPNLTAPDIKVEADKRFN